MSESTLLQVAGLRTEFPGRGSSTALRAVDGVSLHVNHGEIVAVVGESGCGKTMLALSILRLVPDPGRIVAGKIAFAGHDLLTMDDEQVRRIRGADVAMTFQDPMTSLNPLTRVGSQIHEAMTAHDRYGGAEAEQRVVSLLGWVRIGDADRRRRSFPHQFSGGMRQRVMVAMGIANEPSLLIADEPTTALDVSTQAQVVQLLSDLNAELRMAILLITHNMALVGGLCQRVIVMYAGRVVEEGPVAEIFERPQHPYTWALLRSVPRLSATPRRRMLSIPGSPPDLADPPRGCTFHPRCGFSEERCTVEEPPLGPVSSSARARCWVLMENVSASQRATASKAEVSVAAAGRLKAISHSRAGARRTDGEMGEILRVEDLVKHFPGPGAGRGPVRAVDGVSFAVRRGETLAVIGESGSGKSTLARVIAQLLPATSGRVIFEGRDLVALRGRGLREVRQQLQIIFQDPFSSLDPRMTVGRILAEPLSNFDLGDRRQRRDQVGELLEVVGLSRAIAGRYPHEFSGGQRQRIGIARALAVRPSLVLCDEPVSALDVSIQAQIINLLKDLQQEFSLTYIFIAHDLGVVRSVADRVAVTYLGKIVEVLENEALHRAQHPYTRLLLDSVPIADPAVEPGWIAGSTDSEAPIGDMPSGCRFRDRCPIARPDGICTAEEPALQERGRPGQLAACHFAEEVDHAWAPRAGRGGRCP